MPRLMEKNDWRRTVADIVSADHGWSENVVARDGTVTLSVPEAGRYQVILVKLESEPKVVTAKRKSARDMLGYGARFHKLRTTEEWMQELREGEQCPKAHG